MRARRTAVVVVTAGLGFSGCGAAAPNTDGFGIRLDRPVTRAELAARAESRLLFPGSVPVRRIGMDESKQPEGHEPDPAFAGAVATTAAPVTTVLGWYDAELARRGWKRAGYYRQSSQVAGAAWTAPRSREQVQVGIYKPGAAPVGVPRGRTTYEQILVSYRVTGPPP